MARRLKTFLMHECAGSELTNVKYQYDFLRVSSNVLSKQKPLTKGKHRLKTWAYNVYFLISDLYRFSKKKTLHRNQFLITSLVSNKNHKKFK